MADEDDEELKLAIELSLQPASSPAREEFESSTESCPPTPNRKGTPEIDGKAMAEHGSSRKATRTLPARTQPRLTLTDSLLRKRHH
jgi:Ubiquitin interaction motif